MGAPHRGDQRRQGQVVFEQDGVEVPKFYSKLATDIVASKYFYGAKGTEERESSVRQLVHRVASTIAAWGYKDGYFATGEEMKTFEAELAYLCLNQYGAFNSPVWFNVGLSACYGVKGPANNWRWEPRDQDLNDGLHCARPRDGPCEDAYKYPQGSACFIQASATTCGTSWPWRHVGGDALQVRLAARAPTSRRSARAGSCWPAAASPRGPSAS